MLLIEPTMAYAKDIEAYRQEFLDIEGSMDGCGSLRRCATAEAWIEKSLAGKDPGDRGRRNPQCLGDAAEGLLSRGWHVYLSA